MSPLQKLLHHPTFGSPMPTRSWKDPNAKYKYGFNGKEKDNEINVDGGDYDFGARIYNSRLGRWLSLDPLMKKYPQFSTYCFALDNPSLYIDFNGKDVINGYIRLIQQTEELIKQQKKTIADEEKSLFDKGIDYTKSKRIFIKSAMGNNLTRKQAKQFYNFYQDDLKKLEHYETELQKFLANKVLTDLVIEQWKTGNSKDVFNELNGLTVNVELLLATPEELNGLRYDTEGSVCVGLTSFVVLDGVFNSDDYELQNTITVFLPTDILNNPYTNDAAAQNIKDHEAGHVIDFTKNLSKYLEKGYLKHENTGTGGHEVGNENGEAANNYGKKHPKLTR